MSGKQNSLEVQIQSRLESLRATQALPPETAAQERDKFLRLAEELAAEGAAAVGTLTAPVSAPRQRRLIQWMKWMTEWISVFQRKERSQMLNILIAIGLALMLTLGSGGAAVYAAQDSMPDETLYPLKTWSEDLRLAQAGSLAEQLQLTLEFSQRRSDEMAALGAENKLIPAAVSLRQQAMLESALQLAAGLDDAALGQALAQIRQQAQAQEQAAAALMAGQPAEAQPQLEQLRQRLQEQADLAAAGQADPQGFRLLVRDRDRTSRPTEPTRPQTGTPNGAGGAPAATPQPGGGNGNGSGGANAQHTPVEPGSGPGPNPTASPAPGNGYGPGPNATQTPQSGGGYGPGPNPTASPDPGSGPGPNPTTSPEPGGGPGSSPGPNPSQTPQSGGGAGPNPSCTPEPGSGSGPGPGPNPSQTPQSGGGQGSRP